MATRVRNQRGEGERLRTALLDAASELLAETHDVDQLSVRAVTARAGVSPTAMYLHFSGKAELTEAVKARSFEALTSVLREADAEHEGDPRAQLIAMGHAYLRFAREQPGQYAILFQTPGGPDKRREDLTQGLGIGGNAFGVLVNAVQRLLGDDVDPFELACVHWMSLHGLATAKAAMPKFPFPDEHRYIELVVDRIAGARR
ncbi:MAG TPA: TetR/AcrR family transcriptional regulator [Thermoleophilaceae bacterium]